MTKMMTDESLIIYHTTIVLFSSHTLLNGYCSFILATGLRSLQMDVAIHPKWVILDLQMELTWHQSLITLYHDNTKDILLLIINTKVMTEMPSWTLALWQMPDEMAKWTKDIIVIALMKAQCANIWIRQSVILSNPMCGNRRKIIELGRASK